MKRCFALISILALICLWGCGGGGEDTSNQSQQKDIPTVGVALPEETGRFAQEGESLKKQLVSLGYGVMLEYAQQDASLQCDQLERMLSLGVDCLVIEAVDALPLAQVLQQAEKAGVPVISYDRALPNCPGVDLHIGFDNYQAGQAIGKQVETQMALSTATEEQRSHTVEFFMGAPEDPNALARYQGIMAVLQPYIDNGALKCLSGRIRFEDCCTEQWSAETVQDDCRRYLDKYYDEQPLEICVAASDGLADGCVKALSIAQVDPLPMLTGQEITLEGARRIAQGNQAISGIYDYDPVMQSCVEAVHALLTGAEPKVSGETDGVKACLFTPVTVTAQNYEKLLIDSGIFTKEQLN